MIQLTRRICLLSIYFVAVAVGDLSAQTAHYADPQHGKFFRDWLLLGPITTDSADDLSDEEFENKLFDADLLKDEGGEAAATPKPNQSSHGGVWKAFTSDDEAIDFSEALELKSHAAFYASATFDSKQADTGALGIGSDDAVKVWLNGELIHENWTGRALRFDEDLVLVKLRNGENRLLLKIVNWQADCSFACRFLARQDLTENLVKAAASRDEDRIKDLLAAGADINAPNKFGVTPYLAAKMNGNDKAARMLEVLGAETNVELDPQKFISSYFEEHASKEGPGIAVLVSKGDEVLFSKGFGLASVEHDVPITTDTKFRIGSVSKQFTAAAILKLQEADKLSVNDKLSKFLPDFPRGDEVTIHHLLTHTSGLKNFTSKPDFYETVTSRADAEEMIKQFTEDGFDFDPGEKFAYCNTGYYLLSHIVEKLTGDSFEAFLKSSFFEPLEMHDSGVHSSTEVYKHEATGYSMEDDQVKKAIDWDMSRAGGAGNIYSTVNDLRKWNHGIFGGKVLSEASLQSAQTVNEVAESENIAMPYGYGWMMDEHRGLKRIGHSGGLQGFVSQLNYYPEHDVTVVALHNALPSVPGFAPGPACDAMAEAFFWKSMKSRPKYIVDQSVDPATYDDYVGRYDYISGVLNVTREDDKLMAQITGQPKFEIFPMGKDKFFWKVVDAQAEFKRDSFGKVSSVRHSQGIAKFNAPRVKERVAVTLPDETLDRFTGKYDYGSFRELTIRREGKQLFAQMTGQPEMQVFPESETKLFWRVVNAQLEFDLNKEGEVQAATHFQAGNTISVKKIE